MNSCRIFPSTVATWKPLLQRAVGTSSSSSSAIYSPAHFQAYCIDPRTNKVMENLDYSSMLSANSMPSPKRQSGVLVLLEPVHFVAKNKNENNGKNTSRLPLLRSELRTYVTRRTSHLRTHKGEISFPGGKCDGDETPQDAAVREGIEEIGADPSKYEILGQLSRVYSFPSRSFVVPTVAVAKEACVVEIDVDENNNNKNQGDSVEKPIDNFKEWKADGSHLEKNNDHQNCEPKSTRKVQSTLDLKITSACEVETIETMNLCELLILTNNHHFVEREWRPPSEPGMPERDKMRWMLPAFYTNEDRSLLWGLTAFVFCELLSRIAHVLQEEVVQNNHDDAMLTEFERDARQKLLTFLERSSEHYLEKATRSDVIGLPPHNKPVKFLNPYDKIKHE